MSDSTVPVAEYLRMSTEQQQYSLDNQHAAITVYAEHRAFSVVKTYADGARSGLDLKRRNGLRQLLHDVMSRKAEFKAILVYDVSRWGRFQDADEAAHYEFLCKSVGIPVHYCAEPFVNDGALPNMLLKALKRTMAGEYSRELGVKVLAGLKRLALLGFKQGGCAGYGLDRMLLSPEGKPKQLLREGERKSVATERVVLVPGEKNEIDMVREIYRMFIEDRRTVYWIAQELKRRCVPYRKTSWNHYVIQQILSHPKYMGCNVFGRTTQKLGTPAARVPEADWVRTPKAYVPIVDEKTFMEARRILQSRTIYKSDADVLDSLRQLLARCGRLSLALIKNSSETPSPSTYRHRFGSLRRAYELIGYGKPSDFGPIDIRRRTQGIREELLQHIQSLLPDKVKIVRRGGRWRSYLRLQNGRTVTVLIARSIRNPERVTWQINPVPRECRRITWLVLLNPQNTGVHEMRLFARINRRRRFHVHADSMWLLSGRKIPSLQDFYKTVTEIRL
jgi:DNA invertase Pin-like site-specific DNA recombinase